MSRVLKVNSQHLVRPSEYRKVPTVKFSDGFALGLKRLQLSCMLGGVQKVTSFA